MEKYEVDEDEAKVLRKDIVTKLGKTEIDRIQNGHAACSFIESTISRGTLTHLKTKDRYVSAIKIGDPYVLFQYLCKKAIFVGLSSAVAMSLNSSSKRKL
jgi:hypothetical protein